jgi:hypothetical protein
VGLAPGGLQLSDTQWALFRAGHAHAGVWIIDEAPSSPAPTL